MIQSGVPAADQRSFPPKMLHHIFGQLVRLLPGLALCAAVTAVATAAEAGEQRLFGRAWLEALVMAILIGTAVRSLWTPGPRWHCGIDFSAKILLEVAVMLLGAAISFRTLAAVGPGLLFGIAAVVALVIPTSFLICRALGLPRRMAILVACGNSICGNSAIAAVAPVIGADGDDVAASIAFTAVLGVLVVLGLPLLVPVLSLSHAQFGVLAGLTVYAVPQVIAAAAPVGLAAVQIGTLVKLVRVLMLGPVVLVLSVLASRLGEVTDEAAPAVTAGDRPKTRPHRPAPRRAMVHPGVSGTRDPSHARPDPGRCAAADRRLRQSPHHPVHGGARARGRREGGRPGGAPGDVRRHGLATGPGGRQPGPDPCSRHRLTDFQNRNHRGRRIVAPAASRRTQDVSIR